MQQNNYLSGHQLKLLHSGDEYFSELKNIIASAKKVLHLQVYILDEDKTGKEILATLEEAAKRGVNVYLMVDGFGSYGLSKKTLLQLKKSGVRFRYFSPLPFSAITQAGRRLHHKVCVADSTVALVGGINIADKYHGDELHKAWFDYAVKVEGVVCDQMEIICERIWQRRFRRRKTDKIIPVAKNKDGASVRVRQNDFLRSKNQISTSYKLNLREAKQEIILVASYFMPSRTLLKTLIKAAKKKRTIKIILSRQSDVPFIKAATTYLYGLLLRNGIHVFEYTESVLHAKVCVVDKQWCTIGSHNLNHLSEFISVEMNIDVMDKSFATTFSNELENVMRKQCVEITLDDYKKRGTVFQQLSRWTSFKLVSWSMWLLEAVNRKDSRK